MAKISDELLSRLKSLTKAITKLEEDEFIGVVNSINAEIEKNDDISTAKKLKIYAAITSLSNCPEEDRSKLLTKVIKLVK